jgi:hypothetical protein
VNSPNVKTTRLFAFFNTHALTSPSKMARYLTGGVRECFMCPADECEFAASGSIRDVESKIRRHLKYCKKLTDAEREHVRSTLGAGETSQTKKRISTSQNAASEMQVVGQLTHDPSASNAAAMEAIVRMVGVDPAVLTQIYMADLAASS